MRLRSLAWGLLVVAITGSALAAPPKKAKRAPEKAPSWSFNATQGPSPLAGIFAPVAARTPIAASVTATPHERTLVREIHPGDPASVRSLRLVLDPDHDGLVKNATLEVTNPGDKKQRVTKITLGPLPAHESLVLASFELVDVDFDGYLDLRVLRDWGSKWSRHTYLGYDRKADAFRSTELAQKLSRIPNVTVSPKTERLVTQTLGLSDPTYASYAVVAGSLRLERECAFTMTPGSASEGTLRARLRNGETFREVRYERAALPEDLAVACERVR
jgi:hypothetical protein